MFPNSNNRCFPNIFQNHWTLMNLWHIQYFPHGPGVFSQVGLAATLQSPDVFHPLQKFGIIFLFLCLRRIVNVQIDIPMVSLPFSPQMPQCPVELYTWHPIQTANSQPSDFVFMFPNGLIVLRASREVGNDGTLALGLWRQWFLDHKNDESTCVLYLVLWLNNMYSLKLVLDLILAQRFWKR